jgi:hypothetical protein
MKTPLSFPLLTALMLSAGFGAAVAQSSFEYKRGVRGLVITSEPDNGPSTPETPAIPQILQSFGGYRAWADGSFAPSCKEYRAPTGINLYEGAVGNGVYRIAPPGHSPTNVYCDMANGGYTLLGVALQDSHVASWVPAVEGFNVPESPSQSSPTFKYSDAFINAVPKSVFRVNSVSGYAVVRYWDGACPYSQVSATDSACFTSYANEGMTLGRRDGNFSPAHAGLHDRIAATGGAFIATSLPQNVTFGWGGGNGTTSTYTGAGSAGTRITLHIGAK